MPGINKVFLVGRLGKDPEIKSFNNGGRVANFSVATSETWKDKNTGEKQERTEWHNITVNSDGLVGVVERFLRKGSEVSVVGKLQTRKWQDKDGNDKYTTEVVVGMGGELALIGGGKPSGGGAAPAMDDAPLDDDVPFVYVSMLEPGSRRSI
jgi:single-strand DNA-binding protein